MSSLLRQGAGAQAVATATDKRFRRAHVKPSRKRTPALKHTWMVLRVFAIVSFRSSVLVFSIRSSSDGWVWKKTSYFDGALASFFKLASASSNAITV